MRLGAARRASVSAADVPEVVRPFAAAVSSGADIKAPLGDAVGQLGFDAFAFARGFQVPATGQWCFRFWGDHPEGWEQAYRERNLQDVDPIWSGITRSPLPLVWDRSSFPDTPENREFFDLAATFGVRSGVAMVTSRPAAHLVEAMGVFSAEESPSEARRLAIAATLSSLWAIGVYGHRLLPTGLLSRFTSAETARARLSSRELECLTLAARGNTSTLIAEDLGISERTVNAHLDRAIRKCGARNRQQAIAHAIRDGTISP